MGQQTKESLVDDFSWTTNGVQGNMKVHLIENIGPWHNGSIMMFLMRCRRVSSS